MSRVPKGVKMGLKATFAMLGLPVAAALTLAQIDITTSSNFNCLDHTHFFRDIDANNVKFANTPLSKVSMLGSHDALSDGIDIFSPANIWQQTLLTDLGNWFGKGVVVRFSRAQKENIYDQLNSGVRYIDARICHSNGTYYNSHTFLSETLEHNLKLILKWLDENPGEFIVFHIYYVYDSAINDSYSGPTVTPTETKEQQWNNLYNFIDGVKYNNKSLFDYDYTLKDALDPAKSSTAKPHFEDLTYSSVCPIEDGKRKAGAIIYYSSDNTSKTIDSNPNLWCVKHNYYQDGGVGDYVDHLNKPCACRMNSQAVVNHVYNNTHDIMGNGKMGISFDESGTKSQTEDGKKYEKRTMRYMQTQNTPNTEYSEDLPLLITSWSLLQKAHEQNNFMLNVSGINWSDASIDTYNQPCIFNYYPIYLCDFATCNDNGFNTDLLAQMSKFNKQLI